MPDFYLQTHDCRITARSKTSQLSGWRVMLQTRCRELFLVMRSKGLDLVTRHVAGRPLPFGCSQSPSTFTRSPDPSGHPRYVSCLDLLRLRLDDRQATV